MTLEKVEKLNRLATMEDLKTFVTGLPLKTCNKCTFFHSCFNHEATVNPALYKLFQKESFLSNFVGRKHNTDTNLVKIVDQCHV